MRLVDQSVGWISKQEVVIEATPAPRAAPLVARRQHQPLRIHASDGVQASLGRLLPGTAHIEGLVHEAERKTCRVILERDRHLPPEVPKRFVRNLGASDPLPLTRYEIPSKIVRRKDDPHATVVSNAHEAFDPAELDRIELAKQRSLK